MDIDTFLEVCGTEAARKRNETTATNRGRHEHTDRIAESPALTAHRRTDVPATR
jgi:hypothetical protein